MRTISAMGRGTVSSSSNFRNDLPGLAAAIAVDVLAEVGGVADGFGRHAWVEHTDLVRRDAVSCEGSDI
jgi:hypothetical protein